MFAPLNPSSDYFIQYFDSDLSLHDKVELSLRRQIQFMQSSYPRSLSATPSIMLFLLLRL